MKALRFILLTNLAVLLACSHPPMPGPDRQGEGLLVGTVTGAGAGAVTGFQVSAGSGPGALVGAGFGAVAGSIHGFVQDLQEESQLELAHQTGIERNRAFAHEVLAEHFRRRLELHPTRDIFPSDLFFSSDQIKLSEEGEVLVKELAALNRCRYPWSRLVVATYIQSRDPKSEYAVYLATERSKALGDYFVKSGIEPRRIESRAVIVPAPLLLDPHDSSDRYSQAIELIPMDR